MSDAMNSNRKKGEKPFADATRTQFEFGTPVYLRCLVIFYFETNLRNGIQTDEPMPDIARAKLRDPLISPVYVAQHGFMLALRKG
jgi:hypothetical protein